MQGRPAAGLGDDQQPAAVDQPVRRQVPGKRDHKALDLAGHRVPEQRLGPPVLLVQGEHESAGRVEADPVKPEAVAVPQVPDDLAVDRQDPQGRVP